MAIINSPGTETYQELVAMAKRRQCTVGEFMANLVREKQAAPKPLPGIVGLFADGPELMDQLMDDVYETRETQSYRGNNNNQGNRASSSPFRRDAELA